MFSFRRFLKGILLRKETVDSTFDKEGALFVDVADDKLKAYLNSATRKVLTHDQTETVENKTIDGTDATGNNTISIDASDATYDNSTSGLTATDAQAAIDEVEGRVDTAEGNISTNTSAISDLQGAVGSVDEASIVYSSTNYVTSGTDTVTAIGDLDAQVKTNADNIATASSGLSDHINDATDAHDASAISYVNTTSGLTATDVQAAVDEVEDRLDTAESDLTSHTSASSGVHGLTGDVAGTTDAQTFSNKTFSDYTTFQSDVDVQGKLILDMFIDSTSSGSDADIAAPAQGILKVTNASLASINSFTSPTFEQVFILMNDTGADIIINHLGGNIITGTGVDLTLEDQQSIILAYDSNDTSWRIIGGSGAGGAGGLTKSSTNISSATTGTFSTGVTGTPIIVARFWDDSASEFNEISPASLTLDISLNGGSIDYDTTGLTFDTGDYLELSAFYNQSISATTYDSGWILVSAINDTPSAGLHRVNLPAGFTDYPESFSVLIDDGSNIYPADYASRLIFDVDAGTYRITFDTAGMAGTYQFRIRARA